MNRTFTCTACGRTVTENDQTMAVLKDELPLCHDCAVKVRILYPRSFTWQNTDPESSDGLTGGSDERTVWVDPLAEMTLEEYRDAAERAETVRNKRREELGGAQAYFRVDDNKRRLKNVGKGRVVPADYVVTGTVLLGTIRAGQTLLIHRREKTYPVRPDGAEVIIKGLVPKRTEMLEEGDHGSLVFHSDVPFIYPGDLLETAEEGEG